MRRMARPKGKKFFPVSITLTQEQIDYLNAQPNASEVIRKILDDLIQVGKDIEANLGAVLLKKELETVEAEKVKLQLERDNAFNYANEDLFNLIQPVYDDKTGRIQREGSYDEHGEIKWDELQKKIPTFITDERKRQDAQVAFKVLKDYDKALASIRQKIQDIKKQIIEGE